MRINDIAKMTCWFTKVIWPKYKVKNNKWLLRVNAAKYSEWFCPPLLQEQRQHQLVSIKVGLRFVGLFGMHPASVLQKIGTVGKGSGTVQTLVRPFTSVNVFMLLKSRRKKN